MEIKKTYIYANSQILAQHNGDSTAARYFYLHDRLGSVRLVINGACDVNNSYTYNPFGEEFATECTETTENPFKFSGQFFDDEISQYYLRARMYDPVLMRFTARDPVKGWSTDSLTIHAYLYCQNNPINYADPSGLIATGAGIINKLLRRLVLEWEGRQYQELTQWGLMYGLDALADMVDLTASWAKLIRKGSRDQFVGDLLWLFTERGPYMRRVENNLDLDFSDSGFNDKYLDASGGQVRHFVGCLGAGYYFGRTGGTLGLWWNERGDWDNVADRRLGYKGIDLGVLIRGTNWPMWSPIGLIIRIDLEDVGDWIREELK